MTTLLIILGITFLLFIWGKWSPDIVALMAMLSLFISGILTLPEALSGFSNPTVLMIASLFIIGEGLARTGWTAYMGKQFVKWAKSSENRLVVLLTGGSGLLSGFVSNTGTVAAMMPAAMAAAVGMGTLPSKLLMPLAFGANTGGLLTLTGTPPNVIVSNSLVQNGGKGFGFFEFMAIGLPLMVLINLYFLTMGKKLLPRNKNKTANQNFDTSFKEWLSAYRIENKYFRFRIRSGSPLTNTTIADWQNHELFPKSIVRLRRRHPSRLKQIPPVVDLPSPDTEMRYHDIITVEASEDQIDALIREFRLGLLPAENAEKQIQEEFISQEIGMAQVVVSPTSRLIDKNINLREFLFKRGMQLIGFSRNGELIEPQDLVIKPGDSLLVRGSWTALSDLAKEYDRLVVCGNPDAMSKDVKVLNSKSYMALAILLGMVAGLVFLDVPPAIVTLVCAGLMVVTACVPMRQVYRGISWVSVVMIAAMIPMGLAMKKTGLAETSANGLVDFLGQGQPLVLLGGIFLLTSMLSQIINNSATAVLMAPIALLVAQALNVSPEPFLIAIAVSASTAFLTPVGTTTNAMVLTSGSYSFFDYVRVGGPLLLMFFISSLLIIPIFWPF